MACAPARRASGCGVCCHGDDVRLLPQTTPSLLSYAEVMLNQFDLVNAFKIDRTKLTSFLTAVSKKYLNNPFHNFYHGMCDPPFSCRGSVSRT